MKIIAATLDMMGLISDFFFAVLRKVWSSVAIKISRTSSLKGINVIIPVLQVAIKKFNEN